MDPSDDILSVEAYHDRMGDPLPIEVLDKDGRVLVSAEGTRRYSLVNPLNLLLFVCALMVGLGILLWAVGVAMQRRAGRMLARTSREQPGDDP